MRAFVNRGGCIGCGLCASTCPEVFRMGEDNLAEVYAEVDDTLRPTAEEARDGCPVSVISLEE